MQVTEPVAVVVEMQDLGSVQVDVTVTQPVRVTVQVAVMSDLSCYIDL